MKQRLLPVLGSACLALLMTGIFCDARVFHRWGSASNSDHALESAGGKSIYATTLSLNGGKGSLTVFSFDISIRQAISKISSLFKDVSMKFEGGTMAFGLAHTGKIYLRFLVLQLDAGSNALVFKMEQSEEEYEKSKKPPEKHLLEQAPEYPGSKPVFFARNDDTGLGIGVAETPADAGEIRRFYGARLAAAGWEKAIRGITDTDIYLKEQSVCYVMVTPASSNNVNRITLLHKRYGMK